MKYHTLSTSSLASEGKKSTLTIYTQPGYERDKMGLTSEQAAIRCELEMAQRALKLQTRRCRQLVAEFTRKLQAKEQQIVSERQLKEDQLSRVLRSLLVFESRLKQEQTFLRHELSERDDIIQRQKREIKRLRLTIQFCKTCSQLCGSTESCDSSSEYTVEAWESGSEFCASVADSYRPENSSSGEETLPKEVKVTYEKNKVVKNTDSYKRPKKNSVPRRTTGTYFEVLKLHESSTESSFEDGSSETTEQNDKSQEHNKSPFSTRMDNLHGIRKSPTPSEEQNSSLSTSNSDFDITIKQCTQEETKVEIENKNNEEKEQNENCESPKAKLISDTITVFDAGEGDTNENWYASASDAEDDDQRNIYRNNPVLECMNQILLQNINDNINTPPQSPELDRNPKAKTQKRVKFSDETIEEDNTTVSYVDAIEPSKKSDNGDYYETPIQIITNTSNTSSNNFYEIPQSIYSNDYEQILSKYGGDSVQNWPKSNSKIENLQENKINRMSSQKMTIAKNLETNENSKHYYIDMDTTSPIPRNEILKKTKVARTPPALPPKPANLVSKFKIAANLIARSNENSDNVSVESEPDYCSISELNLPPEKVLISNSPSSKLTTETSLYDPISLDGPLSSLVIKNQEKNNMQAAKAPQIKTERIVSNIASIAQINMLKNKKEPEIPKLPQVSEIIIPDENEEKEKQKRVEHIAQDNYIKNNSQLLKQRINSSQPVENKNRGPIIIGTSVSSLISGFNNHMLSEIGSRKQKINNERLFSSFERSQSYEKQLNSPSEKTKVEVPSFEKFDLSQNFEEFNLDDCEIGEDFQSESTDSLTYNNNIEEEAEKEVVSEVKPEIKSNTSVEIVRATNTPQSPQSIQSLQQLQKNLNCQRNNINLSPKITPVNSNPEPSYEHFLECTGLSSKSILTPSRMLSNHKNMLKPKDVKLRSKVKSAVFEHSGGTIKYWSEPYL